MAAPDNPTPEEPAGETASLSEAGAPSPEAENNTAEAPAARAGPLQNHDKADVGCLIFLGFMLIVVFFIPIAFWFGGPLVIIVITCLLLVLATPFCNPLENFAPAARWWGRVLTFLAMAGLLVWLWFWLTGEATAPVEEEMN
jgi:hypothetical protein